MSLLTPLPHPSPSQLPLVLSALPVLLLPAAT